MVEEEEERIVKPLPSPGVLRRGSIEGLLREIEYKNVLIRTGQNPHLSFGVCTKLKYFFIFCTAIRSSAMKLQEKSNQTWTNNEEEQEEEEEEEEVTELEIMRHFEAVDKKVFNRGDSHSFRRREKADRRMARFLSDDQTEDPSRTYKVSFLGASSVGKGGLHFIFSLLLELFSPLIYQRPERFVTEMSWSLRYRRR